ncbi:helicase-related protein [Buchananella hordeovulneris]|uniref:Helicase C-terminal domain-containing protein n=1 Tax=Buchananella hordeovulneris TaxID=52770 RepID=A0A1Q5PVI2_9ACTO|nr:helicase-related protein [Buchananella hordeovulneris]OKL51613.1 hypothetical protein BSZ40_07195 [Buchananella hordeovulneris]
MAREVEVLAGLVQLAGRVCERETDAKWAQLRGILDEQLLAGGAAEPRKLIVFTEHRDTLEYLHARIVGLLGRAEAVATIHGGTPRATRLAVRENFTHDPQLLVLLATDAAGEGLNLQRAHLMVNYDLPWNPNRIEQRFGRIHRIGQREVCHLWNLVAADTREGQVYQRLLEKLACMGQAYDGNLFAILGQDDAFTGQPLRELLVEAIRFGEQQTVADRLAQRVDDAVARGVRELAARRAAVDGLDTAGQVAELAARLEAARERQLQPGYLEAFVRAALARLGGRLGARPGGEFTIGRLPRAVVRAGGAGLPQAFERVTFTPGAGTPGRNPAELLAPGYPLVQALATATLTATAGALAAGTLFVDRRPEQAGRPQWLFVVEQWALDGTGERVWHQFAHPVVDATGRVRVSAVPPYLDFAAPTAAEEAALAAALPPTARQPPRRQVESWLAQQAAGAELARVAAARRAEVEHTAAQVRARLLAEINYWEQEFTRLEALERAGTVGRLRASAARGRAHALEARLTTRLAQLARAAQLGPAQLRVRGTALVVPSRWLAARAPQAEQAPPLWGAADREVERRAVAAVLAAERALGRRPEEMARNNPGFDVRSTDAQGRVFFLEVKGRTAGAPTFSITANEVQFARTQGPRHRLALVAVSPAGPAADEVRYVEGAFTHLTPATTTVSFVEEWAAHWARGQPPH